MGVSTTLPPPLLDCNLWAERSATGICSAFNGQLMVLSHTHACGLDWSGGSWLPHIRGSFMAKVLCELILNAKAYWRAQPALHCNGDPRAPQTETDQRKANGRHIMIVNSLTASLQRLKWAIKKQYSYPKWFRKYIVYINLNVTVFLVKGTVWAMLWYWEGEKIWHELILKTT